MVNNFRRYFTFGALSLVIFYFVASGCTWLTFTAENNTAGTVRMPGVPMVRSVHLELDKCVSRDARDMSDSCGQFLNVVNSKIQERGLRLVSSGEEADISIRMKLKFYNKKNGTLIFFLGVLPLLPSSMNDVEGLQIDASFQGRGQKGAVHKRYRFYGRADVRAVEFGKALIEDIESLDQ